MRIVYAHSFDPAGVHIGHREALRAAGVDAYACGTEAYIHRRDFDGGLPGPPDVIVVAPGVGDGSGDWASRDENLHNDRLVWSILPDWVEKMLADFPKAKRVALFHGSPNLWAYRVNYAKHWRERGFALAATTLDYAVEMDAHWLPPAIALEEIGDVRAFLRKDDEPLLVIQTPSVPKLCQTEEFLAATRAAGAVPVIGVDLPNYRCLHLKSRFHAGFDHLRGSFSVNTLENAALGLAPIFGLKAKYAARLRSEGIRVPSTAVSSSEELKGLLQRLSDSPVQTREAQAEGAVWHEDNFSPEIIAQKLIDFYGGLP